ncbi:MAG: Gfo/Idh/MocA family oxidoreductase [Alphaproteobacteria bacterium]|nr:Gfo/Idh/MocA family oxidoreductase [Alphaproteobacteria bacterium]
MAKVRYAVIGAGWISQEAFMPSIAQTGNAEIAAIVSGNAAKARKLADFHKVPQVVDYRDFDALAKSGAIDAVYVATPNSSHAAWAIRAAKHGLHAMVEKPLATTVAESKKMIAAHKKAGTYLMTAYRLHNEVATQKVAEIIASGAIGRPRFFTSAFAFQSGTSNHRLLAEHWGGPLQDVGVYCVNAARHCFGTNPFAASATRSSGHKDKRFKEVEEGIAATLEFPEGCMAQFYAGFGSEVADTYTILGTKGTIRLDNAYRFEQPRRLTLEIAGKPQQVFDFAPTDNFSGMAAYFADCIKKRKAPLADGAEGLADMQVLLAVEAASKTNKRQKIKITGKVATIDKKMLRQFPPVQHRLVL